MAFMKLIALYTCPLIALGLLGRYIPPTLFLGICVVAVPLTYILLWRSLSLQKIARLPRSKRDGLAKLLWWLFVSIMGYGTIDGLWASRKLDSEIFIVLPVVLFMNLFWAFGGMFSILRRTRQTVEDLPSQDI